MAFSRSKEENHCNGAITFSQLHTILDIALHSCFLHNQKKYKRKSKSRHFYCVHNLIVFVSKYNCNEISRNSNGTTCTNAFSCNYCYIRKVLESLHHITKVLGVYCFIRLGALYNYVVPLSRDLALRYWLIWDITDNACLWGSAY